MTIYTLDIFGNEEELDLSEKKETPEEQEEIIEPELNLFNFDEEEREELSKQRDNRFTAEEIEKAKKEATELYEKFKPVSNIELENNGIEEAIEYVKKELNKKAIDETVEEDEVVFVPETPNISPTTAGVGDKTIEEVIFDFSKNSKETIINKVGNIKLGKYVNVIHGTFDNQEVLSSKLLSITDKGITVSDEKDINKLPIAIPFESIIDIFEIKKAKKDKDKFSIFKAKTKIKEFFIGTEEEREKSYKQKLKEKELKEKLKAKIEDKK